MPKKSATHLTEDMVLWQRVTSQVTPLKSTIQSDSVANLGADVTKYENKVFVLPKHLDEKVAALHLAKLGVDLTILRRDQADYIGVEMDGPHKPESYRY